MSNRNEIVLGQSENKKPVKMDVARLLASRLLVTATSGGGKSWLLRLILELVSATTQTIVIDPEGEFASLRELRDMVLVGGSGEMPAEVRSASLLCRKLMELNLSAVIDLSEMPIHERRRFAANFCNTIVDLPRKLWRPCFVAIDEMHEFAMEGEKSESGQAIALLASKGRKRGYCLLGATQRLSKLDKDVAAELKNQFIGQMTLDTDQKRAAATLGFGKDRWPEIRDQESGGFFGFGPAVKYRGVVKFRSGKVETTHPEPGQGKIAVPPEPSAKIKGVLGEFADLSQKADAEIKDLQAAKLKIATLERELNTAGKQPVASSKEADARARNDAATISKLRMGLEQAMKVIAEINTKGFEAAGIDPDLVRKAVQSAADQIVAAASKSIGHKQAEFDKLKREAQAVLAKLQKLMANDDLSVSVNVQHNAPFTITAPAKRDSRPARVAPNVAGRSELTPSEQAVLDAAASFPDGATRQRISIYSGRSNKSSSFTSCFSGGDAKGDRPSLVQRGLLQLVGDKYQATDAGMELAQPTAGVSLNDWLGKLTPSEAKVLRCLADSYPNRLTREQVSEMTGQSTKSSSFSGAFPALRDLGLIEGHSDFAAAESLMEHAA